MVKLDNPTQFIPKNFKLMDIAEDNTETHTCSISAQVPPNCVAIIVNCKRDSGSGYLALWPMEGTYNVQCWGARDTATLGIKNMNQQIKYKQSVANDVFELYCLGWFVEGELKT